MDEERRAQWPHDHVHEQVHAVMKPADVAQCLPEGVAGARGLFLVLLEFEIDFDLREIKF